MGQQQLLLLILGVIIVGVALAVGLGLFGAHGTEANKDGITSSLINIAADAHGYKMRPKTLGGGRPSFVGYTIPVRMLQDDNGSYQVVSGTESDSSITLQGTSKVNSAWTAMCRVDQDGYTMVNYTGWN